MYKVGDKVVVIDRRHGHRFNIGEIVEIREVIGNSKNLHYCAENNEGEEWFLGKEEITAITETPEEITINGVIYIPKPQEKHEWKFGDWARHPEYGVVFVCRHSGRFEGSGKVKGLAKDTGNVEFVNPETLTYISSAETPA